MHIIERHWLRWCLLFLLHCLRLLRPGRRRTAAVATVVATLMLLFTMHMAAASEPHESATGAAVGDHPLSRAEANEVLDTLNDPEKRARFTAILEAYLRSLPLETDTRSTSHSHPVTTQSEAPESAKTARGDLSHTLQAVSEHVELSATRLGSDLRAMTDFPALISWLHNRMTSSDAGKDFTVASVRVLLYLLAAIGTEFTVRRLMANRRPRISSNSPSASSVGLGFGRLVRRLIVVLCSLTSAAVVGNMLILSFLVQSPVTRTVAFGLVNTYLGLRFLRAMAEELLWTESADTPADVKPRLPHRTWFLLYSFVLIVALDLVCGAIVVELGASTSVRDSLQKIIALVAHVLLIFMVIESRHSVAALIRRQTASHRTFAVIGDALAAVWPFAAITALASSWLLWALDVPNAYHRILRFVLATVAVLVLSRFIGMALVGAFDRRLTLLASASKDSFAGRIVGYHAMGRSILKGGLVVVTLLVLTEAWGLGSLAWFSEGHVGYRLAVLVLQLLVLGVIGVLCWEAADFSFERRVAHLVESASLARATRLRTLQPIVRLGMIVIITLLVVMTALSAIGINVGPLLAGAGILGVALGFGSQKLVQDFITGIFLLVEDAVDVGDSVTVAGLSGTVEHLSIRTIRLRAGDGSVHLIPFSSVTSVTNSNRGIGNAAVGVNIDPFEDIDRVCSILTDIVREMRTDPAYAISMQSDLQLWGVDKVDGTMITITGQIVCTDGGRWPVQREFNRRLQKRFNTEGISLAIPQQLVRIAASPANPQHTEAAPPP
jgi:small-conductance mechanosensitive channel